VEDDREMPGQAPEEHGDDTTGNRCSFFGSNKFVGTDEYNSSYIHWYPN
jgi:hypothetical protein